MRTAIDCKEQEYRKGYIDGYHEGVVKMQRYLEQRITMSPPPVILSKSELKKFIGIDGE